MPALSKRRRAQLASLAKARAMNPKMVRRTPRPVRAILPENTPKSVDSKKPKDKRPPNASLKTNRMSAARIGLEKWRMKQLEAKERRALARKGRVHHETPDEAMKQIPSTSGQRMIGAVPEEAIEATHGQIAQEKKRQKKNPIEAIRNP